MKCFLSLIRPDTTLISLNRKAPSPSPLRVTQKTLAHSMHRTPHTMYISTLTQDHTPNTCMMLHLYLLYLPQKEKQLSLGSFRGMGIYKVNLVAAKYTATPGMNPRVKVLCSWKTDSSVSDLTVFHLVFCHRWVLSTPDAFCEYTRSIFNVWIF